MVTGRAELHGDGASGEAIDRVVALIRTPPASAGEWSVVWLDEVSAALLGPSYAVESEGGVHALCSSCPLWDDDVSEPERLTDRELLGRRIPCVGRERELATLDAVFQGTVAEGAASAVLVTGPTGIGKSRLVGEFLLRARGGGGAVEVWYAQGDPLGAGAPFGMLAPMLRRAAGVHDGEVLATARQRIRDRFGALVPEGDTLAWVGELAGVPFSDEEAPTVAAARGDPQWVGDALLHAWEALLGAAARQRPLVILFDNAQWGDAVSMRFIEHGLKHCGDAPWVVIAAGRDELAESFPKLWESGGVQQLRLGPLSRRSAERLSRFALGDGADPKAIARVVEHAGAYPSSWRSSSAWPTWRGRSRPPSSRLCRRGSRRWSPRPGGCSARRASSARPSGGRAPRAPRRAPLDPVDRRRERRPRRVDRGAHAPRGDRAARPRPLPRRSRVGLPQRALRRGRVRDAHRA